MAYREYVRDICTCQDKKTPKACEPGAVTSAAAELAPHTVPKPASVLTCNNPTFERPPAASTNRTSVLHWAPTSKAENQRAWHVTRVICLHSHPQARQQMRVAHGPEPYSILDNERAMRMASCAASCAQPARPSACPGTPTAQALLFRRGRASVQHPLQLSDANEYRDRLKRFQTTAQQKPARP